jgi:hypothetical protein
MMNVLGTQATMSFGSEPDIKAWAGTVALNPLRIPPEQLASGELDDVLGRLGTHMGLGLTRLAELGQTV